MNVVAVPSAVEDAIVAELLFAQYEHRSAQRMGNSPFQMQPARRVLAVSDFVTVHTPGRSDGQGCSAKPDWTAAVTWANTSRTCWRQVSIAVCSVSTIRLPAALCASKPGPAGLRILPPDHGMPQRSLGSTVRRLHAFLIEERSQPIPELVQFAGYYPLFSSGKMLFIACCISRPSFP